MNSTDADRRRRRLVPALFLPILVGGYVWGGYRQLDTVNLSATAGGQYPYLLNALSIRANGVTRDFGDRNRMPLIPALISTVAGDDWVAFSRRAATVSIFSSAALLVVIGFIAFATLPMLPATVVTLFAMVGLFQAKASFVQSELAYSTLLFASWWVVCRVIHRPDWRWSGAAGALAGLAYWAKASAWPLMVAFVVAMVVRSVVMLRSGRDSAGSSSSARGAHHLWGPGCVAGVGVAAFLLITGPYLLDNHERFHRYFYNVNSTFFMWCDSWSEAKAFADAHDLAQRFPDAPPETIPSAWRYVKTHSVMQIAQRFVYGVRALSRLAFEAVYFKYVVVLGVFCLFVAWKRHRLRRAMTARDGVVLLFCAMVLLGYGASYAWYALVAYGDRFILSLVLPIFLALTWFAWTFGQRCALVTAEGRRFRLVRPLFWLLAGALALEGVWHAVDTTTVADRAFVQFYFNESREAERAGAVAIAERGYRGVLQLDPTFAHAYHELGMIALRRHRTGEAVEALSRSVSLRPTDANLLNSLGSALLQDNQVEAAIECLLRAVRLDPSFASAWYNLGGAYYTIGDRQRAAQVRRRLERIDPSLARRLGSLLDHD